MTEPAYPAARTVAALVQEHFIRQLVAARHRGTMHLPPQPDVHAIETIIDAAFWASLRREEGYSPKISLAYLPPERAGHPLRFERHISLNPTALARLAPAVERPGIHLGVWPFQGELCVWGTTRTLPRYCCVLEVIEPGLLVVKYRRGQETGKFVNVVVLKGDQIKEVDEETGGEMHSSAFVASLLGIVTSGVAEDHVSVLMQLAVSMRAHGRGGTLLVVPNSSSSWLSSIVQPISYSVAPIYSELADLISKKPHSDNDSQWQESFLDAVEAVAGLTAVDGATVLNDRYELLAFGAKIARAHGNTRVERVMVTEPIVRGVAAVIQPLEFGGTRHLSAAQFAQDQHDCIALVASQDGRFTIFAWSEAEKMVCAHRIETLLL